MVVDAVLCRWFTLVVGDQAGPDGFVRAVQWLVAFFYADDSLLALTKPVRLQVVLDVPTRLLDRLGLQTNVKKQLECCVSPDTLLVGTRRRHILGG